jgi:tetratricopeptide (TPR) repeat protein
MFGVGIATASAADRLERNRVFWVAAAVVLAVLISLNRQQQGVWQSDIALFGHIAKLYPDQPRVHNNYGAALQAASRHAEAVEQFSIAIALSPGFADPYCNRGSSFGGLKQFDNALRDQSRALELDSTDGGCAYNRAITYLRMGRYREALADLERARALNYQVPAELENSIRRRLQ